MIHQHPLAYLLGLEGVALLRAFSGAVDLVVCAIALVHLPDLGGPLREFARVLRPDGHLVASDQCGLIGDIGLPLVRVGPGDELGYIPVYRTVRPSTSRQHCRSAFACSGAWSRMSPHRSWTRTVHDGERAAPQDPDDPPWIWALHAEAIDATNAAWRGKPSSIIWHFQR